MWYILKMREVVEVGEKAWRAWFVDNAHMMVLARQELWQQNTVVTTMFLGLPVTNMDERALFLTRVDGGIGISGRAYRTYEEAMKGHLQVCAEVTAL